MIEETKECHKHGLTKHKAYGKEKKTRCLKCSYDKITEQRRKNKVKLVMHFGGKCIRCGYNKCVDALTFHHRNPEEKEKALQRDGVEEKIPTNAYVRCEIGKI